MTENLDLSKTEHEWAPLFLLDVLLLCWGHERLIHWREPSK